ncbi:ion transport protein domain-containing protein [Ditylenchus destructor]|uniref:Ion transport protein domain-containing protein n=1 Tax=Ditylenchus destructor TaxID=166010 RepID=A0AAD4RAG2_9BILA|nr:ion transport protein domain-containing protein [Ditylenchus destructor]
MREIPHNAFIDFTQLMSSDDYTTDRPECNATREIKRESLEDETEVFKLNIGGKSYRFRSDVILSCREDSLLSILIRADHKKRMIFVDGFIDETGEYYLERNSHIAEHVVEYFLTGKLHKPHDICLERFREELLFWHLVNVEVACLPEFRKVIWHLMENPSSSVFSKCFSVISITFIFISVAGLILGSMPEFQEDSRFAEFYHVNLQRKGQRGSSGPLIFDMASNQKGNMEFLQKFRDIPFTNGSSASTTTGAFNSSAIQFFYKPTDNPHPYLIKLEYYCIGWFTLEYTVRFLVSPQKSKFFKRTMNLIDLFTFLPFFAELALSLFFGVNAQKLKEITGAMLVIRILRVLRMARVFKLARYSSGLQVFGNTLKSSLRELCMLSMFLVTGTVFFSTIMFFLEKDEPGTDFRSIPAACWWCIITVTTVGYGDCLIQTTAGKTVAAIASIFGIIILAFPISMVVENFAFAQQQSKVENQLREAQMAAVANDYLMKRYPSRRKACREPLTSSIVVVPRNSTSAYHSIRHANRRVTSGAILD